jgi:prepilin-type N-terminal cleavage/methylation domain-containing protein
MHRESGLGRFNEPIGFALVELAPVSKGKRPAFTLVELPVVSKEKRAAFTLVELLVVIGIIAVLISLLLPALHRARAQSQQIQCASILRNWGQAFEEYAVEYKGVIPHSGDESTNPYTTLYTNDPAHPENECCYTYLLPPLMHRPSWKDYFTAQPGSLLYGQRPIKDIWQCPLAQEIAVSPLLDYDPVLHGYHSYVMNEYLDWNQLPVPKGYFAENNFLNLAKAKYPSQTLLMFEVTLNPVLTSGGNNPQSPNCNCGMYPRDNPSDLGDRHPHQSGKLGGNLMMLDGHIEWTDHLWDPTLAIPTLPPVTNHMWWPY